MKKTIGVLICVLLLSINILVATGVKYDSACRDISAAKAYEYTQSNKDIFTEIEETKEKILVVEELIGDKLVKYWEHIIDDVCIKNDYILLHLDIYKDVITMYKRSWTDLELVELDYHENIFEPHDYFWRKKVCFPDEAACLDFYTFYDTQEYPIVCWEVRYINGATYLYTLDGTEIGYGVPAPSKGFSLSGFNDADWPDPWLGYRENADFWFKTWCTTTVSVSLPTPTTISSYMQDSTVDYFYELAHGDEYYFQADTVGSNYYATTLQQDMINRQPIKFAFIGSCHGMTSTGPGTFSYEFRKGQMANTVTVGYDYMETCPGWEFAVPWQNSMFENMSKGITIKTAFDMATARYPTIAPAVVFIGDTNLEVSLPPTPPVITGMGNGKVGEEYEYTFMATDPNGDDVRYYILWGDGCPAVEWKGPYPSGTSLTLNHTFSSKGTFMISAKAKDIYEAESDWGYLEVKMPKHRVRMNPFFYILVERLAHWFPMFKVMLN